MSRPGLHALCHAVIDTLVAQTHGVESAAIVSGDGFEVASVLREGISAEKLAAMASSLLALSEAVVRELRMSACRNVIIESAGGWVITMRVPAFKRELLISVLCSGTATLGSVLFATRDAAQRLGEELSLHQAA